MNFLQGVRAEIGDVELAVLLLTELGDLPEQGDFRFAKLVEREKYNQLPTTRKKMRPPKTYVRIEMLPEILIVWIAGQQPIQIFGSLSTVLKSSIQPSFGEWLEGTDEVTSWDSEFDKLSDFISTTIFEFLPWLLRACSLLAPHTKAATLLVNWQVLAEKIQRESTITDRDEPSS